jgi:hypothetical protein
MPQAGRPSAALHRAQFGDWLAGAHHTLDHPENRPTIKHFLAPARCVAGYMYQLHASGKARFLPVSQSGERG